MNFWSENIDIVWHVAKAYNEGSLALFVGAGVSHGCGFPLWPELVKNLHIEAHRRAFPGNDAYGTFDAPKGWGGLAPTYQKLEFEFLSTLPLAIQSRFCKSQLGASYKSTLRDTLYAGPYHPSATLQALLKLDKLKAICNYNFDDLIETLRGDHTFVPVNRPEPFVGAGVPVYHVHGLLPSTKSMPSLVKLSSPKMTIMLYFWTSNTGPTRFNSLFY